MLLPNCCHCTVAPESTHVLLGDGTLTAVGNQNKSLATQESTPKFTWYRCMIARGLVAYRSSRDLSDQWDGHTCSPGQLVQATPSSDENWLAVETQGHGTKFLPLRNPRKPGVALFDQIPDDGSGKLQKEYAAQQQKHRAKRVCVCVSVCVSG